jgi:hypothetical protein
VRSLFRGRDASKPLDTLRLRSSDVDGAYDEDDAKAWIRAAVIKCKARDIHLIGHRKALAVLEHAAFVSSHLKVLKLSYAMPCLTAKSSSSSLPGARLWKKWT